MIILQGKSVFRDVCIGKLFFYNKKEQIVKHELISDKEAELRRFAWARQEAASQLRLLYEQNIQRVGAENASVFEIHEMMLEDASFCDAVCDMIKKQSVNAEYAVSVTGNSFYEMFQAMEDAYMKERAGDMKDISCRLLRILSGEKAGELILVEPAIIAADELSPSETVQLPREKVLGFAIRRGSANSHTAILVRSMGIPALVGIETELGQYHGLPAAIDGYTGRLYISPSQETLASVQKKMDQSQSHKIMLQTLKGKENVTKDGRHIKVYANAGNLQDVEYACENDAGGIGLFRSEMLYLDGESEPEEERQFTLYRKVLERMKDKEVIIRTLDIGADKQANYLHLEKEDNPAMGCRAIRLCLSRPSLFKTQLRALYRAGLYGRLSVMYPMITSLEEIRRIKTLEGEVKEKLAQEGAAFAPELPTGIMIETPAAALISSELARHVDFFSVGTNDLTQYTLAIDRSNAMLEEYCDPHHPAVLRLIRMAAESAHRAGIRIGICGELAADLSMTEEFIRMGIDELSVAPGMILPLRLRIRELDLN